MLLYGATPRGDTNPAAHALIETFGSLDNVLNASFDDLKNVHGVGKTERSRAFRNGLAGHMAVRGNRSGEPCL